MTTATTLSKPTSLAGNTLRFLFSPQMGKGIKPTAGILLGFVQMIAQFFAGAGLIPATHRALHPHTAADARLGEVIAIAYHTLRHNGRADQWAVFLSIISLMALVSIMLLTMIVNLLLGTANAQIVIENMGAACAGGVANYFFISVCGGNGDGSTDMAISWINMLLLGGDPWWAQQIASSALTAGLEAMFETYSLAMLVLAGFLVMYHLVFIIAGTAHDGQVGGKTMNQVWAPIRLVMAIGMLVPINQNGLNVGQLVVVNVAKWGSALASNIWIAFAENFAENTGPMLIMPMLPPMTNIAMEAVKIQTCMAAYATFSEESNNQFTVVDEGWQSQGPRDKTSVRFFNYYGLANDVENGACGKIEMPNPNYVAQGVGISYFGVGDTQANQTQLRQGIMRAQRAAVDHIITAAAPLGVMVWQSSNASNSGETLSTPDLTEQFNGMIGEARDILANGVAGAVAGYVGGQNALMLQNALARGWVSASVWFNDIARVNGMALDYTSRTASIDGDVKYLVPPEAASRLNSAIENAVISMTGMPVLLGGDSNVADQDSLVMASGVGSGSTYLDGFMNLVSEGLPKIMGTTSASVNELDAASAQAVSFKFGTANPLAELSSLGHRLINLGYKVSNDIAACIQRDSEVQVLVSKAKSAEEAKQIAKSQPAGPCGSGVNMGPGAFFMQSMIGMLIASGITLGFLLPLIPFIRFLFGIMAWLLSVLEGVVAIPIVALAHIKMEGEGIAGPMARTAYMLLLQIAVRPTLMVFGFILALLIFNLMVFALNQFYEQAIRGVEVGGFAGAISGVVYSMIYAALAYAVANASFKAIDMIPNQALNWIGGPQGANLSDEAVSRASGAAGQIGSISGNAVSSAGRAALMRA